MNILYIAYSCKPNKGSEEKIGWNVPVESAKHNKVFVVTKIESREAIEEYLKKNPIENIKFYYIDIAGVYKKIFKGIMHAGRLNRYHKKAYPLVKKICRDENIDVIHQITPIEFRSVGNFSKIKGVKFVCGPLGGGEYFPPCFKKYAKGNMWAENARKILNFCSKLKYKICKTLKNCDYVLFTNKETKKYLSKVIDDNKCAMFSDVGISQNEITPPFSRDAAKKKFTMLVAGRLAYRKGHEFLLEALKELPPDFDYECRFLGEGPIEHKLKTITCDYGLQDKVVFRGRIPYEEMAQEYRNADVFIMPSIRETSGAVLLESLSNGLPIITMKKFGAALLLDGTNAYFYEGNALQEYKKNLNAVLLGLAKSPLELLKKGENARQSAYKHVWDEKVKFYNSIYKKIVER